MAIIVYDVIYRGQSKGWMCGPCADSMFPGYTTSNFQTYPKCPRCRSTG